MSALLCGIDQITKAALLLHKAQDMPDREFSDRQLIVKDIYTFIRKSKFRF
jgi:hypothetical protein